MQFVAAVLRMARLSRSPVRSGIIFEPPVRPGRGETSRFTSTARSTSRSARKSISPLPEPTAFAAPAHRPGWLPPPSTSDRTTAWAMPTRPYFSGAPLGATASQARTGRYTGTGTTTPNSSGPRSSISCKTPGTRVRHRSSRNNFCISRPVIAGLVASGDYASATINSGSAARRSGPPRSTTARPLSAGSEPTRRGTTLTRIGLA